MPRRLTTEEFIEKAVAVHGHRYDYSRVEYVNAHTPVTILCTDHGPYSQAPTNHLKPKGCPDCSGNRRMTTCTFVQKAQLVHGELYDYSHVKYAGNKVPVTILCPKHGAFYQTPHKHLMGQRCAVCAGVAKRDSQSFVERAQEVHGNRYDYSEVDYVNNRKKVTIICREHGRFRQGPKMHIRGNGCSVCSEKKQLTTMGFIEKARALHGERYDYSSARYVNANTKVIIRCTEHGEFAQTPTSHLSSRGCPHCADYGFKPNEPAVLYYLAITTREGDTRYKIGITNNTVEQRFQVPDLARIRVVKTWRYSIGRAAAEREAEILCQYAGDKYEGPPILQSGNTELFTHDVLGLDK